MGSMNRAWTLDSDTVSIMGYAGGTVAAMKHRAASAGCPGRAGIWPRRTGVSSRHRSEPRSVVVGQTAVIIMRHVGSSLPGPSDQTGTKTTRTNVSLGTERGVGEVASKPV